MLNEYRTVSKEAVAEIDEKKSRFIASVKPVKSEEEAQAFVNMLKSKYWDASHNVYAYYICSDSTYQKFSDDGEPSGTAGMPVLEAIKRANIQDAVIVVTRYFGGTLLGASGLVRAYGKAASEGIIAAGVTTRSLCIEVTILLEYSLLGKVQNMIAAKGYTIKEVNYTQDVELVIYIPEQDCDAFQKDIIELTSDQALVSIGEKLYLDVIER